MGARRCRTAWSRRPFLARPSPLAQPVAVGGEAEQALHAVITRRTRLGDAPLIGAAGPKLPVFGAARLIAVVDLHDFGGVFDRQFVRTAEISEHIVARAVTARTPL